jgi:hypothetical protein
MTDEHAKPGDTIEITESEFFEGCRYTVVEPPTDDGSPPGSAWIKEDDPSIPDGYFEPHRYKIVKRAWEDCIVSENGDVDENIRKRVNENLRSVFE